MTSLTLSEYILSESQTIIDGDENNNGTLGKEQSWSKGIVSFVCLKMKREKKIQRRGFPFYCTNQVDSGLLSFYITKKMQM